MTLYLFRPSEVSSKKRVPKFREIVPVPKKKEVVCDPRFDERAGKLNEDLFKKSFHFIEEMKKTEKQSVVKESKRTRNPDRKRKLQRLLQQMVLPLSSSFIRVQFPFLTSLPLLPFIATPTTGIQRRCC